MFVQAIEMAKQKDAEREEARKAGKRLPKIHGIPFSMK